MILVVAAAMAEEGGSVRHHVAQAKQFVKNKWYDDAALEIEAALAAPGGADSFDAHWLGAQVYLELVDVARASELAERAAILAPNADAREQAANFSTWLKENFGVVEVRGPEAGITSRLQIERTSVVFDADQKRLINKVALKAHEQTRLPTKIGLPAGEYLVNGVAVTIPPGGTIPLVLDRRHLGAAGLAALQVTRVEVGAGASVLFGDRVSNLGTGGAFELGLTQPVGPVQIGLVGVFDLREYTAAESNRVADYRAVSGGVRLGQEFSVDGPLSIRPAVGVRYGLVPGVPFSCDEAEGALTCVPLHEGEADVEIYALGRAVTPFAELSVAFREAGRTTALGVGVKAVVEEHIGSVANPGQAVLADLPDGSPLPYTAEPGTWTATGLRLLAHLSIAL